jgi:hypothetical protein
MAVDQFFDQFYRKIKTAQTRAEDGGDVFKLAV